MSENACKFPVKPLVVAIAATLCLEIATGAWARGDAGTANGRQAGTAVQVDAQSSAGNSADATKSKKPASAEEQKVKMLGTINVTGIAGSQERDLVLKRFAPQIQDSITATQIGQLPDVTISGALARIPGVQIGRSGGEGSTVAVRGLGQVAQTLNGEIFLSPGGDDGFNGPAGTGVPDLSSGQPDFIDIPPTLFTGADVIKSITASNLAGGISGIINLRTHRPFDFHPGWTASGSLNGNWGDRTKKFNKAGSLLASYRTDRWGVLFTGSYSTENITNDQPVMSEFGNGSKLTVPGAAGYYYAWDPQSYGTTNTKRDRLGLNGSFQFKIGGGFELIADGMFTQMQETGTQYAILLQSPQGPVPGSTPLIGNHSIIKGLQNFANISTQQYISHGPTDSLNTNLQLKFDNGGFFTGDLRWVHGHAKKNYVLSGVNLIPNQLNDINLPDGTIGPANPNGIPNIIPVDTDFSGTFPNINIQSDLSNPEVWQLTSAYAAADKITAGMDVFRGDGELHFDDLGPVDSFEFGARYQKNDYVFNNSYYLTPIDPSGACADPLGPGPNDAYFRYVDPRTGLVCNNYVSPVAQQSITQLPAGWLTSFNNFSPLTVTAQGLGAQGFPALNFQKMRDPVKYLETIATTRTGEPKLFQDPTQSWAVKEKIKSFYGQLNFSGQFGSIPWRGNLGVRRVNTTLNIINYLTDQDAFIGNSGSWNGVLINQGAQVHVNKYNTWLPALNVAFNVTDDQVLRVAVNKTQANQSLANLGQGASVFYIINGTPPRDPSLPASAEIFDNGVSGNPDLEPYRSTNYDASYGWYFNSHSLLSVGAFMMDVAAFPEQTTVAARLPDADGIVRRSGAVSTIVNGGGSKIHGAEAEFRTQFTMLPGWLNGFGVNLNYTYLTSTNNGAAGASHTYNAVVFYEKNKLQARVAYGWQGSSFALTNSTTEDDLNIYSKAAGYLDASVEYQINKHLWIMVQGTNLTDEHDQQYIGGSPKAWWSANISERRYYAGLRMSF